MPAGEAKIQPYVPVRQYLTTEYIEETTLEDSEDDIQFGLPTRRTARIRHLCPLPISPYGQCDPIEDSELKGHMKSEDGAWTTFHSISKVEH